MGFYQGRGRGRGSGSTFWGRGRRRRASRWRGRCRVWYRETQFQVRLNVCDILDFWPLTAPITWRSLDLLPAQSEGITCYDYNAAMLLTFVVVGPGLRWRRPLPRLPRKHDYRFVVSSSDVFHPGNVPKSGKLAINLRWRVILLNIYLVKLLRLLRPRRSTATMQIMFKSLWHP